jgi:hypothetical protein
VKQSLYDIILKALSQYYNSEVRVYYENTYTYESCCGPETDTTVEIYFRDGGHKVHSGSLNYLLMDLEVDLDG